MESTRIDKGAAAAYRSSRIASAYTPGKLLLFGEHSVLHGGTAVGLPLQRGVAAAARMGSPATFAIESISPAYRMDDPTAPVLVNAVFRLAKVLVPDGEVSITLESEIPLSAGLGSSAAMLLSAARAMLRLTGTRLADDALRKLVHAAEQRIHGRSSGVDGALCLADGPLWFQAGSAGPLSVGYPLDLLVADSLERRDTGAAVARVHGHSARDSAAQRIFAGLNSAALTGSDAIRRGDLPALGCAMNEAHTLLALLGVSTPRLDAGVALAREAGAFGAKLTGAGDGGCIVALVNEQSRQAVTAALVSRGFQIVQ